MVVFMLQHVPPFPKWPILYLSPGAPALRMYPDFYPITLLLGPQTWGGSDGGSSGHPTHKLYPRPEKSSAWSAGGGNKLLPNQPRPVAGEELQPPSKGTQLTFHWRWEKCRHWFPTLHPNIWQPACMKDREIRIRHSTSTPQPTSRSTRGIRKLYHPAGRSSLVTCKYIFADAPVKTLLL